MQIIERLTELADSKFADFNSKLLPTLDKETIIGVKTPQLKLLARELISCGESEIFMAALPHRYFEENQLHAFLISQIKDFDIAIIELIKFLPYIDNWATCDQLILMSLKKSPEKILPYLKTWLCSKQTYTVRFAIGILLRCFQDNLFKISYSNMVCAINTDDYYVNMMQAWYFATLLSKHYDKAIVYFTQNRLNLKVHNKAIQKACESFRVPQEHKNYLNSLKR